MKSWKCPYCHRERESEDKILIYICPGCQDSMIEIKKVKKDGEDRSI